jgi:hypothetical protein
MLRVIEIRLGAVTFGEQKKVADRLAKFNRPGTALANVSAETIATIKKDQANVAAH